MTQPAFCLQLKEPMAAYVAALQDRICQALEHEDGTARFVEDHWERPGGGGGRSRAIANGAVFEKGGVNVSTVFGKLPEALAEKMKVSEPTFFATGISLVIHPVNPHVPTIHANFRYFVSGDSDAWFGGGIDLTPYVANEEDARHFHAVLRQAAVPFGKDRYHKFKQWCDEYFYIRHRGEARGIGGMFYDYLRGTPEELAELFNFQQAMGDAFLDAYLPIVQRRKETPFTEREKKFQLLRRGRYVEFNLVYDRGTLFGLETNGRIESILMSLPPVVNFDYNAPMETTSNERTLMEWLRNPRSWE